MYDVVSEYLTKGGNLRNLANLAVKQTQEISEFCPAARQTLDVASPAALKKQAIATLYAPL